MAIFEAMIEALFGLLVIIFRPIIVTLGRIFGPPILKFSRLVAAAILAVLRVVFFPFRWLLNNVYLNRNHRGVKTVLGIISLLLMVIFVSGIWILHSGKLPEKLYPVMANPGFLTLLIPIFCIPFFILLETRWPKWDGAIRRRNIIIAQVIAGTMLVSALIPSNHIEDIFGRESWYSTEMKSTCFEPDPAAGMLALGWQIFQNQLDECDEV